MDFVRALIASAVRAACLGGLLYMVCSLVAPEANAATQQQALYQCQSYIAGAPGMSCKFTASGVCGTTNSSPAYGAFGASATPEGCWHFEPECPAGSTWKVGINRCFSPEECTARNSEPHMQGTRYTAPFLSKCDTGCVLEFTSDVACVTIQGIGGGAKSCSGKLQYTGEVCDYTPPTPPQTDPPPPEPETQTCTPTATGQTFCIQPDGQHCYSASTGRMICWPPGQVGTQTDGPTMQVRGPGDSPPPPPTTTPMGDPLTQNGQPTTTTTTITNNSTTTNTITTTVVNYGTQNGTNAGTSNTGTGQGTTGAPGTGPGGGDDDDGSSATPGMTCAQAPQCSGGDAIGCAMLRQQHALTCRDGSTAPVNPEGGTSIGDAEVTKPVSDIFDSGQSGGTNPFQQIDMSGWAAAGNCPIELQFSVFSRSFVMDGTWLCRVLDAMAALVNIVAAVHAAFIIAGGRK